MKKLILATVIDAVLVARWSRPGSYDALLHWLEDDDDHDATMTFLNFTQFEAWLLVDSCIPVTQDYSDFCMPGGAEIFHTVLMTMALKTLY